LADLKGKNESIVILGDMLELGGETERLHEEVGRTVADTGVGILFLKGDFSDAVARGAVERGFGEDRIHFAETPDTVMAVLRRLVREEDWMLIKGSRRMKMEEFLYAILEEFG